MVKLISWSSALLIASTLGVSAQAMTRKAHTHKRGTVAANGRCNGVSYGTGARRCGGLSGGPAGGISGRN